MTRPKSRDAERIRNSAASKARCELARRYPDEYRALYEAFLPHPPVPVGAPITTAIHGSIGGYQRHWRAGEKACEPCLAAQRAYSREWKAKRRSA